MHPLSQRGFSLVELSIVLVILGLLAGGILGGQSLIRAAELRSISVEHQRWVTASQSFRDKYFALPGDMANATAFWGTQVAGAACVTTASSSATTCNGDGNGRIDLSANSNEIFRFWQHLANAGLIEGNYTGVQLTGNSRSTGAGNAPRGKINSSYWFVEDGSSNDAGAARYFQLSHGNYFMYGAWSNNNPPALRLLPPPELWMIDTKVDDGRPARGKLIAYRHDECTTSAGDPTQLNADYLLDDNDPHCAILYIQAF